MTRHVPGNPIRRSFSQGDSRRLSFSQESAHNNRSYSQLQDPEPSQNTLFHRRSSFESFPIGSLSQKTSLSSGDSDVPKAAVEDASNRSVSKFDEFTLRSRHNDICSKLDGIDRYIRSSADAAKKADFQISDDLKSLQSVLLVEVKNCFHSIQEMQRAQQIMIDNVCNLSLLISSSNESISKLANSSLEFPGNSIITSNKRNMLTLMDTTVHPVEERKSAPMCATIAASSMIDPNSDMSDSDSDSRMNCMSVKEFIALKRRKISQSESQPISFVQSIASPKERSQNIFNASFINPTAKKNSSHSVISATDSISLAREKKSEYTNLVRSGVYKPSHVVPPQRKPTQDACVVPAPLSVAKAKIIEQIYRTTSSKPEASRKSFSDKALPVKFPARCDNSVPLYEDCISEKNRSISDSAKAGAQAMLQSPAHNPEKLSSKIQSPKPANSRTTIVAKRPTLIEPTTTNAKYTMKLVVNKKEVVKSASTDLPGNFPQSDPLVGKSWFAFSTGKKLYYPLSIVRMDHDADSGIGGGGKVETIPYAKVSLTIRSECSDEEEQPDDFTTQTSPIGGVFWFLAIRSVHVSGRVLMHFSCPDAPHVRPLVFRVPIIPQSDPRGTVSVPNALSSSVVVSSQQAPKLSSSSTLVSEKSISIIAAPPPATAVAVAAVESVSRSKTCGINHHSTAVMAVNNGHKAQVFDSQRVEESSVLNSSWTEDELEKHGRQWVKIKNDKEFAISLKGRSVRALSAKYIKIHENDKEDGSSGGGKESAIAKPSERPAVELVAAQPPRPIVVTSSQEYTMELLVVSAELSRGVSCPIPQSFQQLDPIPGFEDSWFTIPSTVSSRMKYYTLSIARITKPDSSSGSSSSGGGKGEVEILPTVAVSLTIRSQCSGDADDPAEFTTKAVSKSGVYRFIAVESVHIPGHVLFQFSCPEAPYIRPLSFTVPIITQSPHPKNPCPTTDSSAAVAATATSSTWILGDIGLDGTMNGHFQVVGRNSAYTCTRCRHTIYGQVRALEHVAGRKAPGKSSSQTPVYPYCLKPIDSVKQLLLKYWARMDTVIIGGGSGSSSAVGATGPFDNSQVRGSGAVVGSRCSVPSTSSRGTPMMLSPVHRKGAKAAAKPLPQSSNKDPADSSSNSNSNSNSKSGVDHRSQPSTQHQSSVSQRDLITEETCTTKPGDLTWLAEWGLPSDSDRNRETNTNTHSSPHLRGIHSHSHSSGQVQGQGQGRQAECASPESVLSTETEEQWADRGDTERSMIVGLADQQAAALYYLDSDTLGDPDRSRRHAANVEEEEDDDDKTCITSFEAQ